MVLSIFWSSYWIWSLIYRFSELVILCFIDSLSKTFNYFFKISILFSSDFPINSVNYSMRFIFLNNFIKLDVKLILSRIFLIYNFYSSDTLFIKLYASSNFYLSWTNYYRYYSNVSWFYFYWEIQNFSSIWLKISYENSFISFRCYMWLIKC